MKHALALFLQIVIHRDIRIRDLPSVFAQCIAVLGGILIILCVAKGLTSYLVDAEVPARLLECGQGNWDARSLGLLGRRDGVAGAGEGDSEAIAASREDVAVIAVNRGMHYLVMVG